MTTLVVGASGATGRLVVSQLLAQGETVKVIVRSLEALPHTLRQHPQLSITEASLLQMTDAELLEQVQGCRSVISCLGHNLTLKGMFAQPRRLVADAVQRLCHAIEQSSPEIPVKFILMNTTGNQNKQAGEKVSLAQSFTVALIRTLLPPHYDNELAASYLQSRFGTDQRGIEWVAVRPDSLTDQAPVTEYDVHTSPIRSAIFDAGKTSRINVAHFMSELAVNNELWQMWKQQMPVIYNTSTD
jgi:nucleoside-diphosphate-sugar epimerase